MSQCVRIISDLIKPRIFHRSAIADYLSVSPITARRLLHPTTCPKVLGHWERVMSACGFEIRLRCGEHLTSIPLVPRANPSQDTPTHKRAPCVLQLLATNYPTPRVHRGLMDPVQIVLKKMTKRLGGTRAFEDVGRLSGVSAADVRRLLNDQQRLILQQFHLVVAGLGIAIDLAHVRGGWTLRDDIYDSHKGTFEANVGLDHLTLLPDTTSERKPGAPARKQPTQGTSHLLDALRSDVTLRERTRTVATAAGLPAKTVQRWFRDGHDATWEGFEILAGVLGGRLRVTGTLTTMLSPLTPSTPRVWQAERQAYAIYRATVRKQTGHTGERLETGIATYVQSIHTRMQSHIAQLPPIESQSSILEFIRLRRQQLNEWSRGSILEMALLTGLTRPFITQCMCATNWADAAYLRWLTGLGISLSIITTPSNDTDDIS